MTIFIKIRIILFYEHLSIVPTEKAFLRRTSRQEASVKILYSENLPKIHRILFVSGSFS